MTLLNLTLSLVLIQSPVFASKKETAKAQGSKVNTKAGDGKTTPDAGLCEYGNQGVIGTTKPSGVPSYFFRTFDRDGKSYVSFATDSKLKIVDMESNKEFTFEGAYDPVPLNEDVMTTPSYKNMHLYKTDEILKGNQSPKEIAVGNGQKLEGVYQSVGQMKTANPGEKKYRLITDYKGGSLAEYQVSGDRNNPEVTMSRMEQAVCKGKHLKLPMLSKDGSMVSAYDSETGTTRIWKIEDQGECQLIADLGIGVGKADFNYQNDQLAFHTTESANPTEYFDNPSQSQKLNVYIYDLKKKTLKRMTQNKPGNNSYYPVFRPDGTIVYSQVNTGVPPVFVHADPNKVQSAPANLEYIAKQSSMDQYKMSLAGQSWARICGGGYANNGHSALANGLTLDRDTCRKVVDKNWPSLSNYFFEENIKVTKEEVLASCPNLPPQKMNEDLQKDAEQISKEFDPGKRILVNRCSVCHGQFSYANLKDHEVSKDLAAKMKAKLMADQMPPQSPLTQVDKSKVLDYLEKIIQ